MIRRTLIAAAAVIALGTGAAFVPAHAQTVSSAEVNSWVYDNQGKLIGSVKGFAGNDIVLQIGTFNTPGNHLVTVPAREISASNGRVILNDAGSAVAMRPTFNGSYSRG